MRSHHANHMGYTGKVPLLLKLTIYLGTVGNKNCKSDVGSSLKESSPDAEYEIYLDKI